MKVRKANYGYMLILYVPIVLIGLYLAILFPQFFTVAFNGLNILALILSFVVCFFRGGKKSLQDQQTTEHTDFLKLLMLQFFTIIAGYCFYNNYFSIHAIQAGQTITIFQTLPWYMLLFPWPFILLLSLALRIRKKKSRQNSIRFALQPIFHSYVEKIFGIGVEIYVKQGLQLACAYTITLALSQLYVLLLQYLKLPLTPGLHTPIIFVGTLFLIAINSRFWSKLIHYFWIKRVPFIYLLILLCVMVSVLFILLSCANKLISVFNFANIDPLGNDKIFNANAIHAPLTYCVLWLLWTPLIAFYLSRTHLELNIRQYIISGLIMPICLSVCIFFFTKTQFFATTDLANPIVAKIMLSLLSMLLVIMTLSGFRDPAFIGLVQTSNLNKAQKTISTHQFMQQLSNFIIMYAILILIIGPQNLTILTFSFALPNLITISVASIIALHHIFVEK